MELELELGRRLSDSGESDDSSVPSRYSSEGDVPLLAYDTFFDSDDALKVTQTSGDTLQSGTLSISEQKKIVGILSVESEESYFGIFPSSVEEALTNQHAHIAQRLMELPGRTCTVVIAGGNLLKIIDPSWKGPVPASVLCDACVFSPTRPVMVLTFRAEGEDNQKVIQYNTQLAMLIVQHVKVDTKFDFNVIHDSVDATLCKETQNFLTRIEQCENSAKCICFPTELHMDGKKCTTIIETFLKYLSDDTESAKLTPPTGDKAYVKTISLGTQFDEMRQQLRTMEEDHQQAISEVNQRHEDKLSKLMYLHAQRKEKMQKEIEELTQKLYYEKRNEALDLSHLTLSTRKSSKNDTFPKCSVCQLQFTLRGPAPYLMPCLHAVCETCLTSAAGGVISCSTCHREVDLTDTSLQKDAVRQKEIFHLTVKHRPAELLCANNDGNQAVCWCQDCKQILCEYCQNMHITFKLFREHVLQSFSDMVPIVSNIPTFCSSHKHNALDLFDTSCQKLICARCKLHRHADHDVEELGVAADAVTKQFHHLKDELLKLQARQTTHMESVRQEIKFTDRTHDTLKENIGHTLKTLRSLLEQRESELMTDLERQTKEAKATKEAILSTIQNDRETCTDVSDYIEKILHYAPKVHILELKSRVGGIARSCLEDVRPKTHVVLPAVFKTDRLSELKSVISVFGAITTNVGNVESFKDKDTQTHDEYMAELERKHKMEITELKTKMDSDIQSFKSVWLNYFTFVQCLQLIAEKENIEKRLSKNMDVLLGVTGECGVHSLKSGTADTSMVLKCTPLKYDKDRANLDYVHINTDGDLVNRKSDTRPVGEGRLKKYAGTCSTVPLLQDGCPKYWEVETRVSLDKPLSDNLLILEIGVCREEERDVRHCMRVGPHSYCMNVAHCAVHGGICRGIYKEGKRVLHLPDSLPNTAGASHTLHYGVVYDDARKKIVFIDVKEEKVISTLSNIDCSEPLWPMFGVYNPKWITVSMRLVAGTDINMTEEKNAMIVKALQ
ncbi:uncharacterized protein [Haliotis asinina]|uniref:uncharacterized protein n=1 Tax=Haliotis asinina TaxID=109174 RepID=UPI003531C350